MRRFAVVVVAALALLAAEIAVFVLAVKVLGLVWALLLGIATCVLGGWLLKREGVRGWRRFRAAVAEGRPPGREATDGLLGLLAALLLVIPGFITDLVGAVLLAPPMRRYAGTGVRRIA